MTSTALITGASAGIGKHLARVFAQNGHNLVLVARREAPMQELADTLTGEFDIGIDVHPMDLSGDQAADHLFNSLADAQIDIVVNNAGVLTGGRFPAMAAQDVSNMVTLNVQTLTNICHRFSQPMIERGHGKILNIASIAAFQPIPKLAVYAATKAYVLALSESLAIEMAPKGVTVTAVCPGYTDTEMLRGPIEQSSGKIRVPEFTVLDPARVAADAYEACMDGDAVKVPGIGYAAAMATTRLMPKWMVRKIAGKTMG
ncbi:MAG: SDR family NAD(P)-dependent oxidoreductase [Woeseiaceae bacterium]